MDAHSASCDIHQGGFCSCGFSEETRRLERLIGEPPAKKIRVLRVLEYVYDTPERMADDLTRWHVPPTATVRHGSMSIRSATFLPEIEGD